MPHNKENSEFNNYRIIYLTQNQRTIQPQNHHHEWSYLQVNLKRKTVRKNIKKENTQYVPFHRVRLVSCFMCLNVQSVPGTVDTFRCGSCNGINECSPVYALLRCFNCKARVCYPNGVSDFIKCTRCNSVNEVSMEVKEVIKMVEEPKYHVFYDKEMTLKGNNKGGVNPYAGTL